jgi:hypothetical protein
MLIRRWFLLAAAVGLAAPATIAATDQPDGALIVRPAAVLLPDYAAREGLERSATRAEYDEARNDRRFVLERFTYASDGLEVSAYLYRPAKPQAPLPLVVFIRGSYIVTDQAPLLVATLRRVALAGFVVVAPMLRGSDGMDGRDEMGGADLHDVGNAISAASSLGLAAADTSFLYGESRARTIPRSTSRTRYGLPRSWRKPELATPCASSTTTDTPSSATGSNATGPRPSSFVSSWSKRPSSRHSPGARYLK